jgi:peptidoglycan/xylan/chitin deacetylase (PgdA/CDA1 family)
MRHVRLEGLPPQALTEEVHGSRSALEAVTHAPVTGFCYPYGVVSPAAQAAVREVYDYGCAIQPGPPVDRWALPRFHVGEPDGAPRLLAKLALRRWRERLPRTF